jgi:hypothetical protein
MTTRKRAAAGEYSASEGKPLIEVLAGEGGADGALVELATPVYPTPVALWKQRAVATVTLPSGNVARLQEVNLSVCLFTGKVPSHLLSLVKDFIMDGQGALGKLKSLEDVKSAVAMMNFMVEAAMVEPRVWPAESTDPAPDDWLTHNDIAEKDRQFIAAYSQRPQEALATFRQ